MAKKKIKTIAPHDPLNIIFATFSPWENKKRHPTNGMIEPMIRYVAPYANNFILIDEPHPGSDVILPIIEHYTKGKLVDTHSTSIFVNWLYPFLQLTNTVGTRIPFKIRDLLTVIETVIRFNKKCDVFIGLESINALAGVFLKKIGKVEKVIYYVSDYSPSRYKSSWFNKLYLELDRQAAMKADYIWDVSKAMLPARIKVGLDKNKAAPMVHVPNALYMEQINYLPISKVLPKSLVFAGTLGEENGPDLAIKALAVALKKIKGISLHIYGGGESDLTRLKNLATFLSVTNNVKFHGFYTDQIKLSQAISKYSIGLAPYIAIPGSPRWWADATKIRLYLAAGLPVITTQVPPLGKELVENNAGMVTKDTVQETAAAIIKLVTDKKLYKTMRANAIKAARNNTWDVTYSQALNKSGIDIL